MRIKIPDHLQKDLLYKSARTCCVCKKENEVIIHHIDNTPSNNEEKKSYCTLYILSFRSTYKKRTD